jgi:hypothetical protein
MTPEKEQRLLEGDVEREQRKQPLMGWGDARTAPSRMQARIIEIRKAIIAKRPVPAPSSEYRSQAETFAKNLFRTRGLARVTETPTSVERLRRLLDAASIF